MKSFTKIRKWAEEKGYIVEDYKGLISDRQQVTIHATDDIKFQIENRESTVYQSIRGKRGNPKGIYLSTNRFYADANGSGKAYWHSGYGFCHYTQKEIIESMETTIKRGW